MVIYMLIKVLNQIITLILCLLEISCVNSKQEMFNLTKAYSEIFIQDNECINSDKITAFIESQVDLIDSNFKEVITEQSNIYIALCDIDDNGIPEFFLGSLIRTGINYCCYDLNFQPIFNFTGGADRPFLDGRKYKNPDGIEYYRTVTYIGNPTYPGAIISVIKNEDGEWYVTDSETYNEDEFETTDSYTEIHAFEVEIDRSDIKGSVEKCFEGYYGNSVQG